MVEVSTVGIKFTSPTPLLVLDNAGTATIVIFVNNAGILLSKSPMATVVHVSAGQKEEVHAGGQHLARCGAMRGGGAGGSDRIVDDGRISLSCRQKCTRFGHVITL
jgi:hypothetical protein